MAAFLITGLKISIFLLVTFVSSESLESSFDQENDPDAVTWLSPNDRFFKNNSLAFQVFCYKGIPKSLLEIWRSIDLILVNAPLTYEVFSGDNESEVHEKFGSKSFWHPSSWFFGQKTIINFPAFSQHCIGISSPDKYAIFFNVKTANYWRLLQAILGMSLFMSAPSLSRNPFFHYAAAISVGVLGSVLLLILLLSRFIPKKSTAFSILIFGSSFVLYFLQKFYKDLNEIISKYMDLVLAYCIIAALISFVVFYRLGPIQNDKTLNIIQWTMQFIGTMLIYLSSEYREVSTAIIVILIIIHAFPPRWSKKIQNFWCRLFPPKVKLLTAIEFDEQGNVETKKALENLRNYCSSPDCNVWKTITRLKDPIRFAQFIESGSHCTDQELLCYNSEDLDENQDEDSDTEPLDNSYMGNQRNGYRNYR